MLETHNRRVETKDLCGIHYVAEYVGLSDQAVSNWVEREYIQPLEWLGQETKHLLHWPSVLKWLIETKRVGPNGRPFKKVEV